jgi:hypothetical protein
MNRLNKEIKNKYKPSETGKVKSIFTNKKN